MVRTMFDFVALAILRQFVAFGTLSLTLPGGSAERLDSGVPGADAVITLHDRATLWRLIAKPDLAFGEAYMDGRLTVGDGGLESLMEFLMRNAEHWRRH